MKRLLSILVLLLAASAEAQTYLAAPSESANTGSTTTGVYCKPVLSVAGTVSIRMLDGIAYAPLGTFVGRIAATQAPHATNPYNRSGMYINTPAGRSFYYVGSPSVLSGEDVVSLSDGSITGTAMETAPTSNPLVDGTYTTWGYWNTTCQWGLHALGPRSPLIYATMPTLNSTARLAAFYVTNYRIGTLAPNVRLQCRAGVAGSASQTLGATGLSVPDGTVGPVFLSISFAPTNALFPPSPGSQCTVGQTGVATNVEMTTGLIVVR